MSAAEVAEGDGPRIEYWDAEEGVAWMVCEPVLPVHEVPAQRLAALLDRIADARASYQVSMYGYFLPTRSAFGGRRFRLLAIQLRVSAGSITSSRPPPTPAFMALAPS